MMMFSGAVAGLRNPRAHRLINDDPERALEFVAFVSLLAKLLDGAKKSLRCRASAASRLSGKFDHRARGHDDS
jgi:hypothetical protein